MANQGGKQLYASTKTQTRNMLPSSLRKELEYLAGFKCGYHQEPDSCFNHPEQGACCNSCWVRSWAESKLGKFPVEKKEEKCKNPKCKNGFIYPERNGSKSIGITAKKCPECKGIGKAVGQEVDIVTEIHNIIGHFVCNGVCGIRKIRNCKEICSCYYMAQLMLDFDKIYKSFYRKKLEKDTEVNISDVIKEMQDRIEGEYFDCKKFNPLSLKKSHQDNEKRQYKYGLNIAIQKLSELKQSKQKGEEQ